MRVQKRWEGEGGLCWRVENLFIGHVKKLAKKKKTKFTNKHGDHQRAREPESESGISKTDSWRANCKYKNSIQKWV